MIVNCAVSAETSTKRFVTKIYRNPGGKVQSIWMVSSLTLCIIELASFVRSILHAFILEQFTKFDLPKYAIPAQ